MTEKIEIPLSKKKLLLSIAGSIVFVLLGIWLFTNSSQFQDHSLNILRNPIIIKQQVL